jgi:hypothetical protein
MEPRVGGTGNKCGRRTRIFRHTSPGQARLMTSGTSRTGNSRVDLATRRGGTEEARSPAPCDGT